MTLATLCVIFAGVVLGGLFWYPLGRLHGGKAKEKSLKEAEERAIRKSKCGDGDCACSTS